MRKIKLANVDKNAWSDIREMIGGTKISDSKRTIIIRDILGELDLKRKLRPEFNDSQSDIITKKILRRIL